MHALNPARRAFLKDAIRGVTAGIAVRLAPSMITGFAQVGPAREQVQAPSARAKLVLLGTQGGPSVNLTRSETACALVVGGRTYLVDCGYGTLRQLVGAGLGFAQLSTVFITHLHDDHTADLAALVSHQWSGLRTAPTHVYGPHGTAAMVDGALRFARGNSAIRHTDENRLVRAEGLFFGHDLAATARPSPAFKDDRVAVTTIENTHFPDRVKAIIPYRSIAYRFDTGERSIVFSGDTTYSKALVALADHADLFVCEAMDLSFRDSMIARADADAGKANSPFRHVAETHATTIEVGRMAAQANVKTVVLTHLLPGSNRLGTEPTDGVYISGVRQHFSGQVIVGRDLMVL